MQKNDKNIARTDASTNNTGERTAQSNAIDIPSISLPKGGGAIKGIDEKFQVNPSNGTSAFSIPLPLSPNRNGFTPALSVSYNSGAGNSVLGIGWGLDLPSIQRRTDKKLPRYRDFSAEEDTFMFSGAEELVPTLKDSENGWAPVETNADGYRVQEFRPRIEGGFARIERILAPDGQVYWRVTSRDNTTTIFGRSPACRIADLDHPERVFEWLPEMSFDDKGSVVRFEYKAEDMANLPNAVYDKNRRRADGSPAFTNRYLKRVWYGNAAPIFPYQGAPSPYDPLKPASGNWFFQLVLDYGEHTTDTLDEAQPWGTRPDPFSTYRAGFEIRTCRLLKRALLFHQFPELNDGMPTLVRSLDFQHYSSDSAKSERETELEFLESIAQTSWRWNGSGYDRRSLPPMTFEYQPLAWSQAVKTVAPEDLVHAPTGLSGNHLWVDLYNEGINGLLTEQGEGWYYKHNLGDPDGNGGAVQFAPAKLVAPKPSFTGLGAGVLQLADLEANGEKQLVVSADGVQGYFELDDTDHWRPFRAFLETANVDLRDPNVRVFDLDGDGRPEIVLTEERAFRWWPGRGKDGYGPSERTFKATDEEQGPTLVFSDPEQRIFLADMSGDGLTDLVRIRNAEVCYWPNLGHGRFGAKVTMKNSPWFDVPELFNPAHLLLADVSGTGATDLIYLGENQFRAWLNLSGNAWSRQAEEIDPFFRVSTPGQVTVTDLLGSGTGCIVWSSVLPADAHSPMRYMDLMGGQKPHIMTGYNNNLGKLVTMEYESSTQGYLRDKRAGQPWITKLPFAVQVVKKTTVEDKWRNTRFSSAYTYHHGYYDHAEREFRGFGRVEQTDVEDFGAFAAGNANSPYITADETLYQPPVKTITWFHTGAFLSRERILNQFADEYFRPNGGDFYEIELPEPDLEALGLSAKEYREALRACKGMALRTEVYELDVDALSRGEHLPVKFFSAAFHNCHIRRLQPQAGNPYAVFLATESEAITYNYELPLLDGQPAAPVDPRIAHSFNLLQDELGNPLETLAVAYPRWRDAELNDPLLPEGAEALIQEVQREMHLVYTDNQLTNDIHTPQDYRLRVPCEVRTYELTGLRPANGRYFSLAELRAAQPSNWTEIPYQQLPDRTTAQKRLVERVRMLYFAEDLQTALPFGQLNRLGLPYETYKIALTEDLLQAVLGDKLPTLQQPDETRNEMLERILTEGGYHTFEEEPGLWWIRSGIAGFQDDAAAHFYLPEQYFSPFSTAERPIVSTLTYDPLDLYIQSSEDPVGNIFSVERFDYRVLAPLEMRDPNGNLSEVAYDLLGVPAAVAVKGKGNEGDNLEDVPIDLDEQAIHAFFTGEYNEAQARAWLGNASARHIYYFGDSQHPACAAGILREKHVAQLDENETSQIQVAFEYSDGGGAVIAAKAMAEPENTGGPLRWITNGRTVLNNKGNAVKQYEPYFTPHHRYEEPQEVGVTPIIYYDAAGRTVRTEMPDGAFSRVEFSPWHFRAWDANDTVLESQWFIEHGGDPTWGETDRNLPSDPKQRAAYLAKIHANTPAETHTDSLGREVVAIAHNRWRKQEGNDIQIADEKYLSYTKLDAEGKPLWLRDARYDDGATSVVAINGEEVRRPVWRGNYVMVYARVQDPADFQNMANAQDYVPAYDLAGNLLFQHSNEAGDRWMLPDVTGQPMYVWDFNERNTQFGAILEHRIFYTQYDALRRPERQWLRHPGQPLGVNATALIGKTIYGESLPGAEARNLRGQAVTVYGPEGYTELREADFKGNPLAVRRRLIADATLHVVDWITLEGVFSEFPPDITLLPEVFEQMTRYDALNRPVEMHNWHRQGTTPAIYTPTYNRRGALESETLTLRGQVTQAIRRIEYDAKGQRTSIRYGNGTSTTYNYDPLTFRLTRLRTYSPSERIQSLYYTYDPVGNITEIYDLAQSTVFFRNQAVKPLWQYEYDALYRLIYASGREQYGITGAPKGYGRDEAMPPVNFPMGDNALRNYTQRYTYDAVGNFIAMQHKADGGDWTRHYDPDPKSNRLLRTWLGNDETNAVTYRYDTHGSMLNFANVNVAQSNRWDYRDMIHTLDLGGGGTAWYQYDGGKQRTRKYIARLDGSTEERIYLGGYEWYRRTRAGAVLEEIETHHIFADEQRVLIVEEVLRTDNNNLRTGVLHRYQYGNHLGSVGLECDATGQIISYEEYHPYGTTAYQARNADLKTAAKRYRYTGMERDEESGLAYHTARYYLPWLGRWGSCDPIGVEGGGNLYEYSSSTPLYYSDTTGKQPIEKKTPNDVDIFLDYYYNYYLPIFQAEDNDKSMRAASKYWNGFRENVPITITDYYEASQYYQDHLEREYQKSWEDFERNQGSTNTTSSAPSRNSSPKPSVAADLVGEAILGYVPAALLLPYTKDSILADGDYFEFTPQGKDPHQNFHDRIGRRWVATGGKKVGFWTGTVLSSGAGLTSGLAGSFGVGVIRGANVSSRSLSAVADDVARVTDDVSRMVAKGADDAVTSPAGSASATALTQIESLFAQSASKNGRDLFSILRTFLSKAKNLTPQQKVEVFRDGARLINKIDSSWQANIGPATNAIGLFSGEGRPFGFAIDAKGNLWQTKDIGQGTSFGQGGALTIDYSKWNRIHP